MRILLTGHKGFIGSNMLKMLDGHEVSTFEWGDPLPSIEGLDYVIHMGANSSTTSRHVEMIMVQNYDFSVWLLNECIKHNVNFQFSSSASVYGMNTDFRETGRVDPRSPYAWTKYLFERHVDTVKNTLKPEIKIQLFRYFNVYGPGEENKNDQASPYHKFAKQYKETGKIKVFKNSEKYLRDFVSVEQVCKTHIDFFDILESGTWNVGTGTPKSFLDVALEIAPLESIEFIDMPQDLKGSYQEYTCADMTKTHNTLKGIKNELD